MATHTPRAAGLTFQEVCATGDSKRIEAWRRLCEVNRDGRRAQTDYVKRQTTLAGIQTGIAKLGAEVTRIDETIRALTRVPGEFSTEDDIPKSQLHRAENLQVQRAKVLAERQALQALLASNRMAIVKLGHEIDQLRRAARNLSAVVAGDDPAAGPVGGISYVSG